MGIPSGGTEWQKLGAMFPDAVASVSLPPPAAAADITAAPGEKKAAALRLVYWLGVVSPDHGHFGGAGSRFIPERLMRYGGAGYQRIVKLKSDLDKGTKNGESDKINSINLPST